MKRLTPFLAMRAAYDATLLASRDARLSRDAARKAAHSGIAAAIKEHERRMFLCGGYSWESGGSRNVGGEIKAASDAYDKAVKEARDHYDQARKYALTATSKTRKARYALNAASHNKSNRPTK
jgi:hypothetical protein